MKKIYYNITRLDNGWLLSLPRYYSGTSMQSGTAELMFPSLDAVMDYIKDHYNQMLFDNELGNVDEGTEEVEDLAKKSLRNDYVTGLKKKELI